jgi:hypothetical protein
MVLHTEMRQIQIQTRTSQLLIIRINQGTNHLVSQMPIAISIVPSYFPVKNVPSIDNASQQCLNAFTHCSNVHNARKKYCLPSNPITLGFGTYSKCIPRFFAFIACNMTGKCSYTSAQSPYMSLSARYFARHALPYFTWYPHATMITLINVATVNNGQFLIMLTSLCEMNLDNSWEWFISSTFVKQV